MILKFLLFLFFLIKGLRMTENDCMSHLISLTDPKTYTCIASGRFTKDNGLELSTPSRQITVLMTWQGADVCGHSIGSYNILTVSTLVSGGRRDVLIISYNFDLNQIWFTVQDDSNTQIVHQPSIVSFYGPFNLYMTLNMDSGIATAGGIIDHAPSGNSKSSLIYGSAWAFDDSTVITACSDYDQLDRIGCDVYNLKVGYSVTSFSSIIDMAMKTTYKADYKLNDGKGNIVTDYLGILGSATMSNPSPSWIPEGGLDFTTEAQYLEPPAFIPSAADATIVTSIAVSFYIKIDTPPSGVANIFSYYSTKPSVNDYVFRLSLTPTMLLQTQVDTTITPVTPAINLGEWTQIYAGYIYSHGGLGVSAVNINEAPSTGYAYTETARGPSVFTNADEIRIGPGFKGQLRRVQIFSPAALHLEQGDCVTYTCNLDSTFSVFPSCLKHTCPTPGYYTSFGTCEKCPKGCATCSDATTCQSCSSGYYQDGTTCKRCLTHCKTCTNSLTCDTCSSGYGMVNNICILCPSGTYLTNDQTCKKFSPALQDTLTNSQLANSAAGQLANLISKGSSISLSAMVGGKIFSQIKYLNISYSGELQVALLTWLPSFVSLGLTPDMPEPLIEKFPDRNVPYVFEKYEVSSSFLVNFWENLGIVVFISALWLFFKRIELMISPDKNPKVASTTRKARIMLQNFLLSALYGVYGDLLLFSIIEYRSFAFGWNLSLLSFVLSIILFITMFLTFFYQIKLLRVYQKIKNPQASTTNDSLEKFKKTHEGSQIFWKDFKDSSIGSQLFLLFLTSRDLIFGFVIATMFEYPLAQSILIILLNCLMMAYLFIKRPFENTFDLAQQLFFEFVGLAVMVAVFINAIFDAGKYETFQGRKNVGKLVIVANMMFNFVAVVFMLIIIGQSLLEFYKDQKEKTAKKLRPFNLQNRLQDAPQLDSSQAKFVQDNFISTPSPDFETISSQQASFDSNLLRKSQYNFRGNNRPFNPTNQSNGSSPLTNEESFQINERNAQGCNNQTNFPMNPSNARSQRRQARWRAGDLILPDIITQPKIISNLSLGGHPQK